MFSGILGAFVCSEVVLVAFPYSSVFLALGFRDGSMGLDTEEFQGSGSA